MAWAGLEARTTARGKRKRKRMRMRRGQEGDEGGT
jgi:hypothetical protein